MAKHGSTMSLVIGAAVVGVAALLAVLASVEPVKVGTISAEVPPPPAVATAAPTPTTPGTREGVASARPHPGLELIIAIGCTQCHSVDGTNNTGPSFVGYFGKTYTYDDGSSEVADEAHVRASILRPSEKIMTGRIGNMPSYDGIVTDEEIDLMIEWMKSVADQ